MGRIMMDLAMNWHHTTTPIVREREQKVFQSIFPWTFPMTNGVVLWLHFWNSASLIDMKQRAIVDLFPSPWVVSSRSQTKDRIIIIIKIIILHSSRISVLSVSRDRYKSVRARRESRHYNIRSRIISHFHDDSARVGLSCKAVWAADSVLVL